ncbi:MAG: hypothetical protein AAFQ22_14200 [Pseudomonadota bacterium]
MFQTLRMIAASGCAVAMVGCASTGPPSFEAQKRDFTERYGSPDLILTLEADDLKGFSLVDVAQALRLDLDGTVLRYELGYLSETGDRVEHYVIDRGPATGAARPSLRPGTNQWRRGSLLVFENGRLAAIMNDPLNSYRLMDLASEANVPYATGFDAIEEAVQARQQIGPFDAVFAADPAGEGVAQSPSTATSGVDEVATVIGFAPAIALGVVLSPLTLPATSAIDRANAIGQSKAAEIPVFEEDLGAIELGAPLRVPETHLDASDGGIPPIVSRRAVNKAYDTLILVRVSARFVGSEGIAFRHVALGEREGVIVWKDPNIPERMLCRAGNRDWDAFAQCPP